MPIPAFTIDGVLPPYVGPDGPGGHPSHMTPYRVSALEVAEKLGTTERRKAILRGWLHHRSALRAAGFGRGFQWLDGSFVESREPKDLDIVSFLYRPHGLRDRDAFARHFRENFGLFDRGLMKLAYHLDRFPVDLDSAIETALNLTRYYLGLFSHCRGDGLWKGMLEVRFEDEPGDLLARSRLGPEPEAPAGETI